MHEDIQAKFRIIRKAFNELTVDAAASNAVSRANSELLLIEIELVGLRAFKRKVMEAAHETP